MSETSKREPLPDRPLAAAGDGYGYCVTARPSARGQVRMLLNTVLERGEEISEAEVDFLLATASGLALRKLGQRKPDRRPLGSVALKIRDAVYYVRIAALFNVVQIGDGVAKTVEGPKVRYQLKPEYRRRLVRLASNSSEAKLLCSMVRLASQLAMARGEAVFRFRWMMTLETKTGRKEHHPIDFDVDPALWFEGIPEKAGTIAKVAPVSDSNIQKTETKEGPKLPLKDRVRLVLLREGALREKADGTYRWTQFGRIGLVMMTLWAVTTALILLSLASAFIG